MNNIIVNKNILISVIIPCFNSEITIKKTLDSLLNQTFNMSKFEVICIDDCSTDSTKDILSKYSQKFNNFIQINFETNKKQGAARNKGIDVARGEYITFIDSDDYFEVDALSVLYKNSFGKELVIAQHKRINKITNEVDRVSTRKSNYTNLFYAALDGSLGWWPMDILIQTSVLRVNYIKFQEGVFFEDIDFIVKLAKNVSRYIIIDECVLNYIYHTGSTVNSMNNKKISDSVKATLRVYNYIKYSSKYVELWSTSFSAWLLSQFNRIIEQNVDVTICFQQIDLLHYEITINNLWPLLKCDFHNKLVSQLIVVFEKKESITLDRYFSNQNLIDIKFINRIMQNNMYSLAKFLYKNLLDTYPFLTFIKFNILLCKLKLVKEV